MKTGISAALQAHYQQETTTLATLWKITRRDLQVFSYTDHDEPITFQSLTYAPTSAYDAGTVKTSAAMNVDDVTLTGLLMLDAITAADIEAGLWDGARVEIMEVNYEDLTMGENVLRFGEVGEVQRDGQLFKIELRGLMQHLQNNIGRIVTASCDADLGDTRCGVDLEALRVDGTVTAFVSQREFTGAFGASGVGGTADYIRYGIVTWVTGLNAGLSMEVKSHSALGVLVLQLDMPYPIAVADTFTAVPGCNKIGRTGDCVNKFNNYARFRGFEDIPGQAKVLLIGG